MGPFLCLPFNEFAGLRLNEHAFHTWDIEVVFDDGRPPARSPPPRLVVDNLAPLSRFSGRPDGQRAQ